MSRLERIRQLRAWYVTRHPVLGSLPSAYGPPAAFTASETAWFRGPVREGVRS